jgi:virginiamycin A acetyltransferase
MILSGFTMFNRVRRWLRRRPASTVYCRQGEANEFGDHVFLDGNTHIGHNNYFGNYVTVSKSTLGNYCSVGDRAVIGPGEHDVSSISTSAVFQEGDVYEAWTKEPCTIGSDVWIGTQAVVLRGVHVGHGAVIAANAVVTKNVPPYAIVGGVPARLIRFRFSEERIKQLLASQWFDKNLVDAKEDVRILSLEMNSSGKTGNANKQNAD